AHLRIALPSQASDPVADPLAAHPAPRQWRRIKIVLAAIDRRTREPCDLRDDREATQPAVRTLSAANSRRPRSSSFEPTVFHCCPMASLSIMRPPYAIRKDPESPRPESHSHMPTAIRLLCGVF